MWINGLLRSSITEDDSHVSFTMRRVLSDVRMGVISATTCLDDAGEAKLYLLVTDGYFILSGHDFLDETRHNKVEVHKRNRLVFQAYLLF